MINLNDPGSLTVDSVKDLIASKDDSADRQIRVMDNGDVVLSDDIGSQNLTGVRFRLDTLNAGNGYVGKAAAGDQSWVGRVHRAIEEHWKDGTRGYVDLY